MKVCFETELAGFPIRLEQNSRGRFRVTYGLQVKEDLIYRDAGHELGFALMHAAACEGKLDNGQQ